MCIAIYAALFALLLFYSNDLIEQYALSITTGGEEWMVVAIGWEMLPLLWPVGLLLLIMGSGLTLFITRHLNRNREPQQA